MAYKAFTNGSILTDTDLNTYLMRQTVIVCTSGTRPPSPVEGMVIFETDTNRLNVYTGAAWDTVHTTGYPTAWINAPMMPGYIKYVNAGYTPSARFVRPGSVELRGCLQRDNGANIASGAQVVQLGAGYRPGAFQSFVCAASADSSGAWSVKVDVDATGAVQVYYAHIAGNQFDVTWVSLDGISFETS